MRIVFFGTSHGVPEPHRRCSCTLIELGERRYFVDMGTNAMDELIDRGMAPDSVKAIFVTHMHGDHTNGLVPFIDLASWYFKTVRPAILMPEMQALEGLKIWLTANGTPYTGMDYRLTEPGEVYNDGFLRVSAFRTQHCAVSYSYLLEELSTGKKALFTGDLRGPEIDFPLDFLAQNPDLVVCEAAHFTADRYLPVFRGCGAKKICVNHYGDNYGIENIHHIQELARALAPLPVLRASDGLEIAL